MICVIIIKHAKFSYILHLSLNCFPAHQPVATNSMHLQSTYNPYLQHLSERRHICNPVKHLQWSFFADQRLQAVDYFDKRAPLWMFDRILNATLSNNLLQLASLRRSIPSLGLQKETLDSPCLLILLIYTKHKPNR